MDVITQDQMDTMSQRAATQHEQVTALHANYEKSGTYDGDDELRNAVMTFLATTGEFTTKLRAAEASREYTPAGLAARRRTLREPLVLAAERHDQRAQVLDRTMAKTNEEAWAAEIAPARDTLDAMQLTHMQHELRALPEPMRVPVLNEPGPLGRLARRAAFAWPTTRPLVAPEMAKRIQDETVRRLVDLSGNQFTANELRILARRYRAAAGIEEPPIRLGSPGA